MISIKIDIEGLEELFGKEKSTVKETVDCATLQKTISRASCETIQSDPINELICKKCKHNHCNRV